MGSPNLNETLFTTMVADDIFLKPNRPALVVSSTSWWVVLFYFSCSHWWATYMPQLLSNIRLWCHWHIWWFLQFSFSLYNIISLTGCLKFLCEHGYCITSLLNDFFPFILFGLAGGMKGSGLISFIWVLKWWKWKEKKRSILQVESKENTELCSNSFKYTLSSVL